MRRLLFLEQEVKGLRAENINIVRERALLRRQIQYEKSMCVVETHEPGIVGLDAIEARPRTATPPARKFQLLRNGELDVCMLAAYAGSQGIERISAL
jgi:hypothetical protein